MAEPGHNARMAPRIRAAEVAAEYAALPEVLAVALGGSHAAGNGDAGSDLDLYVYSRAEVPLAARREIALRRGHPAEVDNRWWEPGDEWDERTGGGHVDVMFRRAADMEAHLTALLEGFEAHNGYTTALWHNVRTGEVLFDREGWLAALQRRADVPYPDGLARAILTRNVPLLRGAFGAYPRQIALVARRGDVVAVNHRVAELLASVFDVLFALNRVPHPGEKRLLALSGRLPLLPPDFARQVGELLTSGPDTLAEVPGRAGAVVDGVLALLVSRGEMPGFGDT